MDKQSFQLGVHVGEIKAWCEAAKNDAKEMSLSAPFKKEEYTVILPYMREYAERNNVNYYLEKELLKTDLFPDIDLEGIWVFIIYRKQEILLAYLSLKKEKEKLLETREYEGEKRREIARKMGRLLGYSETAIEGRWQ
jgi:hypothetical protein